MQNTKYDNYPPNPLAKGVHRKVRLDEVFIDSCVQIWEDADLTSLHEYGVAAWCVTAFDPRDDAGRALDALAMWHSTVRRHDNLEMALKAKDIVEAKAAGRTTVVITAQGGDFLGANLDRLPLFHALGLRMMLPTYNNRNAIADGCLEPANSGLTKFGHDWVNECNRLGIVIDLTHVGERSSLDIIRASEKPVVFSHSNPRSLVENSRNISDEQIKGAAQTGGLVAPTNWGPLNYQPGSLTRPTLEQYIDAIDYIIDLVGVDHVGIGTDMSIGTYPDGEHIRGKALGGTEYGDVIDSSPRSKLRQVEGFDDYGDLPAVITALQSRGYDREAVGKILGGNWLRVFSAVWEG